MMRKIYSMPALLLAVAATGCVSAPTRDDVAEFKFMGAGKVPQTKLAEFSDCVIDGFDKAHTTPSAFRARQVRRAAMTRVESMMENSIVMSADIHDDGRVELYESSIAALLNLSGEKETFAACVAKNTPQ